MSQESAPTARSRRQFLAGAGAVGAFGLAGCTANPNVGGDATTTPDDGDEPSGTDTTSPADPLSGSITITGSSTVYPLCVAVTEDFRSNHDKVSIDVSPTGSGGGFGNHFCRNRSQFNNASRPITSGEEELCSSNGVNPLELRVATDAVTVIVHPDADWVDCMTVEELKQVWEPEGAQQWNDVRSEWPSEEIDLYGAAATSGTFDYFTEAIVGEEGSSRTDYTATEKDNRIVSGVAGSEYSIGYLGFAYYDSNRNSVKALAVDDGEGCVKPSLETAKSGDYQPLSRPLFTYPSREALAEEHVAEFARFYVEQSANESLVSGDVGYVPNTQSAMEGELEKLNEAIAAARE
jgi:phosphate transport system substrate-binding protein